MIALERLAGGLIVSCQAPPGHPLRGPVHMTAVARAAAEGGAAGIRAEGVDDVAAIRSAVGDLPLIGITKIARPLDEVFITPTPADAAAVLKAGADIVACDATARPRPHGWTVADIVGRVHELGAAVMGDVDSVDSAEHALRAGVDLIATTLSGYTGGANPDDPDLELVRVLAELDGAPVVAEGRYRSPDQVSMAFEAGAYAVVVGTAITNPLLTTRRFAAATPSR